jgi:uncharacterized protein
VLLPDAGGPVRTTYTAPILPRVDNAGMGSPGATDLAELLRTMEPVLRDGEFVYATVVDLPAGLPVEATVREPEGLTIVVRRDLADVHGIDYDYVAAWITLTVHSSLEAVGLTAAFATALGREGISCNVLAGHHHDHVLVATTDAERAVDVLRALGEGA